MTRIIPCPLGGDCDNKDCSRRHCVEQAAQTLQRQALEREAERDGQEQMRNWKPGPCLPQLRGKL